LDNLLAPDSAEEIVAGNSNRCVIHLQIITEDWNGQRRPFQLPACAPPKLAAARNLAAFLRFKGRVAAVIFSY
jgi:hypothetical protein